ncbi:SDR family oxidoreductase [Nocardia beijingensis]|uniref:SDR family oxidoreductase n=1 Tax=Nocardia beijingensis TaxID=95162 RepID=UPI001894F5DF|nr:SDR family oxidoreductase [Nocardia beijingensis]MBF6468137.1 SDR family oxidoreductase [Nocardia beijingensis]
MTLQSLAGRVAVVTGASSGIGAATARELAAAGASVALLARRTDRIKKLADDITAAGGTALAVTADVTDPATLAAANEQIGPALGTVDLLVANAGIMQPAAPEARRTELWQRQIDVNLTGVLHTVDAFLPALLSAAEAGGPVDLIATSSRGARVAYPGYSVYFATKAAVSHLARNLRTDLGPRGVRVSAIEPGMTLTEIGGQVIDPGFAARLGEMAGTVTMMSPADIAEIVAFVASRRAGVNIAQLAVLPIDMPY